MDTIANFITIIRNAYAARNDDCSDYHSNIKESIAKILKDQGFVRDYRVEEVRKNIKRIIITLKYHRRGALGEDIPAIEVIRKISKPGCRVYVTPLEFPKLPALGISIITCPLGVVDHLTAKKNNVGGEYLCQVW